jgi:hypothetical protein
MRIIKHFELFESLNEELKSVPVNVVIGDSLSPLVAKHSKADLIGPKGSEDNLWKGGQNVKWLRDALGQFPVTPGVKTVVIEIGTNGGFNPNEDIGGLLKGIRRVFPNAKVLVVKGSWGWGYNRGITEDKVEKYYNRFIKFAEDYKIPLNVIKTPIGYSATDAEAHKDRPVFKKIGSEIDQYITGTGKTEIEVIKKKETEHDKPEEVKTEGDEKIYHSGSDPYYYKVIGNIWFTKGPKIPNWTSLERNELANSRLDKRYPEARDSSDSNTTSDVNPETLKNGSTDSNVLTGTEGYDPEKLDPALSKEFNVHLIPDNLNVKSPNYRSAQMPSRELEDFIKKYGIKRIIRLNGDGEDGRHNKKHPILSIAQEKNIAQKLGVEFNKLSSTKDQNKVDQILSQGNTLIHCAHGADRTGGNVGGYLYKTRVNPSLDSTDEIWNYTTKYNGWNRMVNNNPSGFESGGYLRQAQKFGVTDIEHAKKLALGKR